MSGGLDTRLPTPTRNLDTGARESVKHALSWALGTNVGDGGLSPSFSECDGRFPNAACERRGRIDRRHRRKVLNPFFA